jgi:hypothetical protein
METVTDKAYYRSRATGDLGYLVEREGKTWVKLDRAGPETLKEFAEQQWIVEEHRSPLNPQQLGKLTYEIDQLLCRAVGRGQEAKQDWIAKQNEEQQEWVDVGPCDDGIRDDLFDAVVGVLRRYTGE